MATKKSTSPARRRAPVKSKSGGEPIPLELPLPGGGVALFHAPGELPPRRSREVQIISTVVLPRMVELAAARTITVDGKVIATDELLPGVPVGMTKEDSRNLAELGEVAAWAYLREWRDAAGKQLDLPVDPDAVADLPPRVYKAVTAHAARLLMSGDDGGFTVAALPDDLDDADPDLPT